MTWLAVLLVINAALVFGYRVFRLTKGGPMGDVIGGAILGALLVGLALGAILGAGWVRWPALFYGVLFGGVAMPIWTLAVLIPMRPGKLDYAFTATYWTTLLLIVLAAILA